MPKKNLNEMTRKVFLFFVPELYCISFFFSRLSSFRRLCCRLFRMLCKGLFARKEASKKKKRHFFFPIHQATLTSQIAFSSFPPLRKSCHLLRSMWWCFLLVLLLLRCSPPPGGRPSASIGGRRPRGCPGGLGRIGRRRRGGRRSGRSGAGTTAGGEGWERKKTLKKKSRKQNFFEPTFLVGKN